MALTKNVNSYVTVAEADAYLADQLGAEAWLSTSEEDKAKALITATGLVDSLTYLGYVESDSQTLAFPRVGEFFDPKLGRTVSFGTGVPSRILNAVCDTAIHLLVNPVDDGMSVDSIKIDVIEIKGIRRSSTLSSKAFKELKPYIQGGGGNVWWRAN